MVKQVSSISYWSIRHWSDMESVDVVKEATVEVPSDHQLIVTSMRYQHVDVSDATDSSVAASSDNASSFISNQRCKVNSRGDELYFEPYRQECSDTMGRLVVH